MGELSPSHLLIVAVVFILLFGSRKLPDAARSLGKSLRIFKAETKALRDTDEAEGQARQVQPAAVHPPVAAPAAAPVASPASAATPASEPAAASSAPLAEAQRTEQSS